MLARVSTLPRLLAAVALVQIPALTAAAAVINVPSKQAPTIQVAINIAANGDEIVVAPGTYFEKLNLSGKTLTIRSSVGPATTTIDALNQFDPVIKIISGEGAATLIEGFTLRRGLATDAAPNERGGGIYCNLTSPTIRNCIFTQNTAVIGGAFYANGGAPNFIECVFESNHANSHGGAGYLNATTANFTDCTFINNTADTLAGAIRHATANGLYLRCRFEGNEAGSNGGALDMASGPSNMTYRDCEFIANVSAGLGGAVQLATPTTSTITWINCVFRDNQAASNGGAVHVLGRGDFINCTFHGNASGGGGGGGAIYTIGGAISNARNCIAWGNSPNGFNGATTATYCNIQNALAGAGNISLDPMFVNPVNGDLRLQDDSPSIDAGNSTLLPVAVAHDFDVMPRVVNGLASGAAGVAVFGYFVDMGAFEFQPEASGPPSNCPADTNNSGFVDVDDLIAVILGWGACP